MHDAINLGVPVLAILFGILINRADFRAIEKRLEKRSTPIAPKPKLA